MPHYRDPPHPDMLPKYGRLKVIETFKIGKAGSRRTGTICLCDCGATKGVDLHSLKRGLTMSCGCLYIERAAKLGKSRRTHGHAGVSTTPEYKTWQSVLNRCLNPKSSQYQWYGARNITVCERWKTFENFLADMGSRPLGKTLDRINNFLGYEPTNCRWATPKEQSQNRRTTWPKHLKCEKPYELAYGL